MNKITGSASILPIPHTLPAAEREQHRCLPIRSTFNFRDLGGYTAADGRKTRWGLLYRSGGLKNLTKKDQEYIKLLGIQTIVDFRSDAEENKEPDRVPEGVTYQHMPIDAGGQELRANLRGYVQGKVSFDLTGLMISIYTQLVEEYTPVYREWLSTIIKNQDFTPLVFHCTAGKDRTGFAAALVLRLLGVSKETILEDYLLTNRYNREKNEQLYRKLRFAHFFRSKRGDVSPMLNADQAYLEAAFRTIDEKWGNFEKYTSAEDGLNLKPEELEIFKQRFLED